MDLTRVVRSTARAHQGLSAGPRGIAREVAIAIGISLSIATPLDAMATDQAIRDVKALAQYTLTHNQYLCHNEIVYRESRWDLRAIGNLNGKKQSYGLYQMKLKSLKHADYKRQYWKYWYYVVHRYGTTEHKDANYCKALHHLKTKGWQ